MSTKTLAKVYRWLNFSQFYLLPGVCAHCRRPSKRYCDLCRECESAFPLIDHACPRCGMPLPITVTPGSACGTCLTTPPPFRHCSAPFAYDGLMRPLLNAFKHHDKLHVAKIIAPVLAKSILRGYAGLALPQRLIPVPLHINRLRRRGYNQAQVLANALGAVMKLPVEDGACHRVRDTGEQKGMNAAQRRRNLRRAFRITDTERLHRIERVAIVDDIVTTMNTAAELAKVLHQAGVPVVDLWAAGRTLRR